MGSLKCYLRDVGPASLTYFASVGAAALLSRDLEPGLLRLAVAALPLPAIVWMAIAEIRRLRRRDELRQRIELETMTIAFAVSFGVITALTFIGFYGAIEIPFAIAVVIMAASWTGAQIWVRTRYRYWWFQSNEDGR